MTNPKLLLLTLMMIAACSTTSAPPPEKIYDFSERQLTGTPPAPSTSHSPKAQMRRAVDELQPRLARCTAGTSGTLDITLRVELAVDGPASLDGVEVVYPAAAAAACAREAIASIDLSSVELRESAVWVVHMPFVVAAYSAKQ